MSVVDTDIPTHRESPGMNTSRSRPSGSIPTGSGTPSNPAARTWRNRAWITSLWGFDGRST